MTDVKLTKILKELKQIQPDPDYSSRSRVLILNSKITSSKTEFQKGWFSQIAEIFDGFQLMKTAAITAVILVLIASGGVYYYLYQFYQSNQEELVVKAGEINNSIQIKLDEIKYILEQKSSMINAPTSDDIQILLGKAALELEEASKLNGDGKNIEELLKKIKSAEELLFQIDSLLINSLPEAH